MSCKFCNRKYKRESKLIEHVESTHPHASLGNNSHRLTTDDRIYLLTQLQKYVEIINRVPDFSDPIVLRDSISRYIEWDVTTPILDASVKFIRASHMLLPQEVEAKQAGGLERITRNHVKFRKRVKESGLLEKIVLSATQLRDVLFDELTRFFNLGYQWNGDNFCPSLVIDVLWHAAMMDNQKYNELTTRFMGNALPHCLEANEDPARQVKRFDRFVKQFEYQHRRLPLTGSDLVKLDEVGVFDVLLKDAAKELEHEKEEEKRKEEEINKRNEKWQQECRKKRESESLVTPRGWRSPWDDGKC